MKVGLIVEGIPDAQVCEYLAKRINPDLDVETVPLGAKTRLLNRCGQTARLLLKESCDRVVVVWDLYPAKWEHSVPRKQADKRKSKPSCRLDREAVIRALERAEVDLRRVCLVCINAMLETWLLVDIRAINKILSSKTRPVNLSTPPKLKRNQDPKSLMIKTFRKEGRGGNKVYEDTKDAIRIAKAIPREKGLKDLNKLRKLESFADFERCIAADYTTS